MAKVKRSRKKRVKRGIARPDETVEFGPMRFSRFGKNIIAESKLTKDEHELLLEKLAEQYAAVVAEIDDLIKKTVELVRSLPYDQLLHRAWWENASSSLHKQEDDIVNKEDIVSVRMLDYVQSIIASVQPANVKKDIVSEEDYSLVRKYIEGIFYKLNSQYFICQTAKKKREDEEFDDDLEKFIVSAQLLWCNVRGKRYQAHQVQAISELLTPQSAIIQKVFGVDSEKLVRGLSNIWRSLTYGAVEACEEMKDLHEKTMAALGKGIADGNQALGEGSPSELFQLVMERHGLKELCASACGKFAGLDLFDLEKLTDLPTSFLGQFSWMPGQETEFFSGEKFKGWPLRIWPVFKRPFIKLDDCCYCFDSYSVFDQLYRQIEKKVFNYSNEEMQTWLTKRKEITESLPLKYLRKIIPDGHHYKDIYYFVKQPEGKNKRCEVDSIFIYGDHLFIIEVKGGSFTYTSPADDYQAHVKSLKELVQKPAEQGLRFFEYLHSADEVSVFDDKRNEVAKIRRGDYRFITICAITLDPFTELAAKSRHLIKIGIEAGERPVWSVSIDDLRVYADVFTNPLEFLHFVEVRWRAQESDILQLDDELDHLGLYLEHNNYVKHAELLAKSRLNELQFIGYRSKVDAFFANRLIKDAVDIPLVQAMPYRLRELIDYLAQSKNPGRTRIGSYLLDLSGEQRDAIFTAVENIVLENNYTLKPKPLSIHGDVRLTIFPWVTKQIPVNMQSALDHTRALMLLNDESDRLLINLKYSESGVLFDVDWQIAKLDILSSGEIKRLSVMAETVRKQRIDGTRRSSGKISRNDSCPCGSGKKYKKCCMKQHRLVNGQALKMGE